jgi:type I restriction enzyme S subunit
MNKGAAGKAGWQAKRLDEVCEIIMGQSPDGDSYNVTGEGVPLINGPVEFSQGAFGKTTRSKFTTEPTKLCRENDLILCVRGSTTGRMNIAGFDACVGRGVAAIRAKEYQPWINHFISSKRDEIHRLGTGATFPNVSGTMLNDLQLPFPPLPEQRRIVGILDEAFDGIATAKANAEKNLQDARALFESHLQSVFTQRGERWVERTLNDVCKQITDGKHGDCTGEDCSGYYFLSAKDVRGGTLNYEGARQITRADFEETHRRTDLEPGDILVTNSGTIGRLAIAPSDDRTSRTTFQKSVAILKPVRTAIDSRFAFHCLSSGLARFVNLSAGTAQKNLLLRDLRAYRLALPQSVDQQQLLGIKLDALSAETQRLESIYRQKLAALDALKKALLDQAFTGAL